MGERTMSDALAGVRSVSETAATAPRDLASKRRAIEEPGVNAFIKAGADATPAIVARPRPASPARPDVQLNTKIPEDLYQRARRAVFECQMSNAEPSTIQDLVSQALHAELKRLGF